jgi:hypothetical protein
MTLKGAAIFAIRRSGSQITERPPVHPPRGPFQEHRVPGIAPHDPYCLNQLHISALSFPKLSGDVGDST